MLETAQSFPTWVSNQCYYLLGKTPGQVRKGTGTDGPNPGVWAQVAP